jgi:hypothetical protein
VKKRVEAALRQLVDSGTVINYERVVALCRSAQAVATQPLTLAPVRIELASYDGLLSPTEEVAEQWSM